MVEDTISGSRSQAMQERSASVTSSDSDFTCFSCCCSPCIGLCYLLCLRKMKVSTRLKIVWFWMIFLSLFGGLYLRYNVYGTDIVSISSHDMMPVQKMSTFFCEGVTVESGMLNEPLTVYLLKNKPRINNTRTVYKYLNIFSLRTGTKKNFHFYLMADASITFSFCTRQSVTLAAFKGIENYENYLETKDIHKYAMSYDTIFAKCNSKHFDITASDRYYFIVGQNWRSSMVELEILLNTTTYQVHGKNIESQSTLWQVFIPLKFRSSETVIYQPALTNYQELTVTTHCEPMNSIYVGLFLGGFLLLGFILSYIVKCWCKDPDPDPLPSTTFPENAYSDDMTLRQPIPTQQIHPTAPSLPEDESSVPWIPHPQHAPSCPPPSYESLFVNGADSEPPSYLSTTLERNRK